MFEKLRNLFLHKECGPPQDKNPITLLDEITALASWNVTATSSRDMKAICAKVEELRELMPVWYEKGHSQR